MPTTAPAIDLAAFKRDGFIILPVLEGDALAHYRAAADEFMRQPRFAERRFHYISIAREEMHNKTLLEMLHHPTLISAVEQILGSPLVFDNAAFLAAEPGVAYRQGWHRDVLQVPEAEIRDEHFSPKWRHNNVQLNLALADDDTGFWAVPGSHHRPDTAAERAVFAGSKHLSPVDAVMPGAINVRLRAGEAALYHNNLIHRGHADFTVPRRTLHFGYHCSKSPPTWHFYAAANEFRPEYLATLSPAIRRMFEERAARLKQYPDVKMSYHAGFER